MTPRTPHLDPHALRRDGRRRAATGQGDQGDAAREPRREFGRDGISGIVSTDRALRAREVSRPGSAERSAAEDVLASLLARIDGRRR